MQRQENMGILDLEERVGIDSFATSMFHVHLHGLEGDCPQAGKMDPTQQTDLQNHAHWHSQKCTPQLTRSPLI